MLDINMIMKWSQLEDVLEHAISLKKIFYNDI